MQVVGQGKPATGTRPKKGKGQNNAGKAKQEGGVSVAERITRKGGGRRKGLEGGMSSWEIARR